MRRSLWTPLLLGLLVSTAWASSDTVHEAGLIEGRVSSANFGRAITLPGPPRTVELGVRFAY